MRVSNMTSESSGRVIANQFIIEDGSKTYFQSYASIIVLRDYDNSGQVTLDERYWNYSMTTGKYRNQFLGEKRPETEAKIKSGEYKLANLN